MYIHTYVHTNMYIRILPNSTPHIRIMRVEHMYYIYTYICIIARRIIMCINRMLAYVIVISFMICTHFSTNHHWMMKTGVGHHSLHTIQTWTSQSTSTYVRYKVWIPQIRNWKQIRMYVPVWILTKSTPQNMCRTYVRIHTYICMTHRII